MSGERYRPRREASPLGVSARMSVDVERVPLAEEGAAEAGAAPAEYGEEFYFVSPNFTAMHGVGAGRARETMVARGLGVGTRVRVVAPPLELGVLALELVVVGLRLGRRRARLWRAAAKGLDPDVFFLGGAFRAAGEGAASSARPRPGRITLGHAE